MLKMIFYFFIPIISSIFAPVKNGLLTKYSGIRLLFKHLK